MTKWVAKSTWLHCPSFGDHGDIHDGVNTSKTEWQTRILPLTKTAPGDRLSWHIEGILWRCTSYRLISVELNKPSLSRSTKLAFGVQLQVAKPPPKKRRYLSRTTSIVQRLRWCFFGEIFATRQLRRCYKNVFQSATEVIVLALDPMNIFAWHSLWEYSKACTCCSKIEYRVIKEAFPS